MAYNGHKNHAAWNVSLWLSNDEGLYRLCCEAVRLTRTKDAAADYIYAQLEGQKTPDGVPYTRTNVRLALVGFG